MTGLAMVVRTLWRQPKARIGLLLVLALLALAALAPLISPYSPQRATFPVMTGPSSGNLLGTTGGGQDVLSQLIYGARDSLIVAFGAGLLSTSIALAIGLLAGYLSGPTDSVLNFGMNLLLVIPALPLMIIISTYSKGGGIWTIVAIIVLVSWAFGGRVVRSRVLSLRSLDFVTAAQFSGDRTGRIIVREILPNMVSLVAAIFFGTATAAVLAEAGLEFLGLGNPATVSWGTMLYWAQNYNVLAQGQWAGIFAPGLCIAVLASAFALLNFGVDELSNPRLREV
ncbi:MAG TPA: ABC transporter permease [Trebonia sp.]|nr:ABC transporter permease [Trebonia sp.]